MTHLIMIESSMSTVNLQQINNKQFQNPRNLYYNKLTEHFDNQKYLLNEFEKKHK